MTTYYTACFMNPDGSGKARIIRFGARQLEYTFSRTMAFSTCQQVADATGEEIVVTVTESELSAPGTGTEHFYTVRPTKRTEV